MGMTQAQYDELSDYKHKYNAVMNQIRIFKKATSRASFDGQVFYDILCQIEEAGQ